MIEEQPNPYLPLVLSDNPTPREIVRYMTHPYIIRVTTVTGTTSEGEIETFHALCDQMGFLMSKQHFQEVIEAVTPFYDTFSEDAITRYNRELERPPTPTPKRSPKAIQKKSAGYVYLMQSGKHHKIGASVDPDKRRDYLGTKPPFEIEIVCTIETDDMYGLEARLHERFADKRKNGEWFELEKDDVEYIKGLVDG